MHLSKLIIPLFVAACGLFSPASATVSLSSVFGTNMVIQRDKPVPVSGTASPNTLITVAFNNQTKTTTSNSGGKWMVMLDPMVVNAHGGTLSAVEAGGNAVNLGNVVVGDVWICSGQSNMDMSLASCDRKSQDEDTADFPQMRTFRAPLSFAGEPSESAAGNWTVCTPGSAASFSAIAFYFGREICEALDSTVPIGLYVASVGGTNIDLWLAPEGLTDIPVLNPLFNQSILPNGPFSLFNGMVYPYSPLPAKGLVWYQGENAERTVQSPDSYYFKMKALAQGYKRIAGTDDFPFYFVQLANWGQQQTSPAPVLDPGGGWSADTRIQQANAMAIPNSGMASAMDVGSSLDGDQVWDGWHPKTKQDVGERLALWALKNDYGQVIGETSGPILRNVTVNGKTLVCTFNHAGIGLMVGSKTPYQPTTEIVGGTLDKFSIAGVNGVWYDATATISGNTVVLSSPSVPNPTKAAYACWQNPVGANLYNKDGLPASPFHVDDVSAKFTITATSGIGGGISPAGTETYLKRHSTLYSITPDSGKYIQDILVDGVSVGAVDSYTFDPLYASHTIAATFASTEPQFTVNSNSSGGGNITPIGAVTVTQGGSQTFTVNAGPGVITNLTIDGKQMGQRNRYVFADIRKNHSISAAFKFPMTARAGYGGTITPGGTTLTTYGSDVTYTIAPLTGFAISKVTVDGVNIGAGSSHTFSNVTTTHSISATFTGTGGGGNIPQSGKLYTSFLTDNLPAAGSITNWTSYLPAGKALTPIGSPTVEVIDGRKFVNNICTEGDGLDIGPIASPIPCTGATIVTVAKPVRMGADANWYSIVDLFYDRLVLGVMNGSGRLVVRRNGSLDFSTETIPDGQTTILSLVVQESGQYKVYANGVEVMNVTDSSAMSLIVPGVAGPFANHVSLGRNTPDSWTTYNGYFGDTFIYTTALGDSERQDLETYLVNRLTGTGTNFTISATATTGGIISPSGAVMVQDGSNQTFSITPNSGYSISSVTVDGTSIGAVNSYTFNGVTENHVVSATFIPTGNTPPTCSAISDQNLSVNSPSAALGFSIGDAASPAVELSVTATSSNEVVVSNAGIALGATDASGTVRVSPVSGALGTGIISLRISGADDQTMPSGFLTVHPMTASLAPVTTVDYLWSPHLQNWHSSSEVNPSGLIAEISSETISNLDAPDNATVEVNVRLVVGTVARMFARLECSTPL